MDRYEEDLVVSVDLIDSIFKYTVMNHEVISTLLWDIKVNDLYENERQKVVHDADYLLLEHEHRCLAIIHNISKYWERLHGQIYMKKRLGLITDDVDVSTVGSDDMLRTIFSDVGTHVTDGKKLESVVINGWEFSDEYDNRFCGLDSEIIPGYEPTPVPIFSVGGFKIPDTFGMFKKVRGRPKTNTMTTSFVENYRFLTNYNGESDEEKLEREKYVKMKREAEASKRGRTIKKVTLKVVPIHNLTTPPTSIKVPVVDGKIIKCDPVLLKVKQLVKSGLATSNSGSNVVSAPHNTFTTSANSSILVNSSASTSTFIPPVKSITIPSIKSASTFIPSVKSITIPSVKSASVPSGKKGKQGKKQKVVPILTSNFTPRLKSLTPPSNNHCKGRPLGSRNKPKIVDIPPNPQSFNSEPIPQYKEVYAAHIPLNPLAVIERAIKYPQMSAPLPKKLISPQVLISNSGEIIGHVGFEEEKDKEPKKRGRPLGSGNVGPTKESDKNVIIFDKEISFSDNPTNFEKHLIQLARKHRGVSNSEWDHHVRKVFDESMSMYKKLIDEKLADWEEKNKMAIKDYKIHLLSNIDMLSKIKSGEVTLDNFDINDINEDNIMKPYVPIYMFEGYNNRDLDDTIRNADQYILYDRARVEADPIRKYVGESENNSIVYKLQRQKVENYLCTNDVVIDRTVSRKIRNKIGESVDEDIIGDILKALKTGSSISKVISEKSVPSVPNTSVTIYESEEDDSVYAVSAGEISGISEELIEDIVEELVAGSCDGNKDIYDEVFGDSESESINGSIYRNYIHDDIVSRSDNHSESGSNTNNSDIPYESPIVADSDNSSEDNHMSELHIIDDLNDNHVDVNNSDEVESHIANSDSDVNNSADIPYVEDIDNFDSDSDIIDVPQLDVNVMDNVVEIVDVPGPNITVPLNTYNNVFSNNINDVILPRLNSDSDEVVDYEYTHERRPRYIDSDDSDSNISDNDSDDDESDNDSDERRRESNRNMFSFFFNEMNIIGSGGLRHNENTHHVNHEVERPTIVEQPVETSVESTSCGFTSYKDFLDFNTVESADQEENLAPVVTYGNPGYTSYKDFLDTNKDVENSTSTYGSSGYTSYKEFLSANNVDTIKTVSNEDVKVSASKSKYAGSKYKSYKDFLA